MLKLVFNEDFSHALMFNNFTQSTVFQITNYSNHQTNINFSIDAASISNLLYFENTPITRIRISDESNEVISNITFANRSLYLLNYNTNIYSGGQTTNVSMGQVMIPEPEPEINDEEGEA